MKTPAGTSFLASALVFLATLLGHATYEVDAFVVNSSTSQNAPIRSPCRHGGASLSLATCSPLFPVRSRMVANKNHEHLKKKSIGVVIPLLVQRLKHLPHAWSQCRSQLMVQLRRSLVILSMAAWLWLGVSGISAPPAYASSSSEAALVPTTTVVTTASPPTTTTGSMVKTTSTLFSKSIDDIVNGYVKHHMFDDDVYDPVESTYREALADQTQGIYPRSLSEVASSVFGQGGVKTVAKPNSSTVLSSSSSSSGLSMGTLLTTGITFLQQRVGLSESTAIFVLASAFVVAGPVAFLMGGMIVGGASKRQMNKVFKQRYGDTYRYVRLWKVLLSLQLVVVVAAPTFRVEGARR
jgi:uncharacterized membrane-anchored protein